MFIHPLMAREPWPRPCTRGEMLPLRRGSQVRGGSRDFTEVKPAVGYKTYEQRIPPSSGAGGAVRELACAALTLSWHLLLPSDGDKLLSQSSL